MRGGEGRLGGGASGALTPSRFAEASSFCAVSSRAQPCTVDTCEREPVHAFSRGSGCPWRTARKSWQLLGLGAASAPFGVCHSPRG